MISKKPHPHRAVVAVLLAIVCTSSLVESAPAAVAASVRQFLPPMPGYIPVYIRHGDTPLEDINLELAEAFRSYAKKQGRLNFLDARSANLLTAADGKNGDKKLRPTVDQQGNRLEGDASDRPSRNIQKIQPKS